LCWWILLPSLAQGEKCRALLHVCIHVTQVYPQRMRQRQSPECWHCTLQWHQWLVIGISLYLIAMKAVITILDYNTMCYVQGDHYGLKQDTLDSLTYVCVYRQLCVCLCITTSKSKTVHNMCVTCESEIPFTLDFEKKIFPLCWVTLYSLKN
jgi:hypothetical protein